MRVLRRAFVAWVDVAVRVAAETLGVPAPR